MTNTTEINEQSASLIEALQLIDRGLGDISERSLVSSAEVADLLLDVRTILTRPDAAHSVN
jgi:hypothetical protein